MSEKPAPVPDPLRAWRDWFVTVEQQWSQSLTDLMKDERVGTALVSALGRLHALLDPEQRERLAYLMRTGVVQF